MASLDTLRKIAALLPDETTVDDGPEEGLYALRMLDMKMRGRPSAIAAWLLERLRVDAAVARKDLGRAEAVGELEGRELARAAHAEAKRNLEAGRALAAEAGWL